MSNLYLIARISGRPVAFVADEVDSVVDLGRVTPVPRAAPGVVGIAALRSRVATVVDPRVVLGVAADGQQHDRAVVGTSEGHLYAILVDALEDVAEYAAAPLPPGVVLTGGWAGVGDTVVNVGDEPVLVVALSRLLPQAEAVAA